MLSDFTVFDDLRRHINNIYEQLERLSVTDTGWVNIPAAAGWAGSVEARKIGKCTYLRGQLQATVNQAVGSVAIILPAQFMPPTQLAFAGVHSAGYARIDILPGGSITIDRATTPSQTIRFDNIIFLNS